MLICFILLPAASMPVLLMGHRKHRCLPKTKASFESHNSRPSTSQQQLAIELSTDKLISKSFYVDFPIELCLLLLALHSNRIFFYVYPMVEEPNGALLMKSNNVITSVPWRVISHRTDRQNVKMLNLIAIWIVRLPLHGDNY